jgi:hypothetical protein
MGSFELSADHETGAERTARQALAAATEQATAPPPVGVKPPKLAFRELSQIVARFAVSTGLRAKTSAKGPRPTGFEARACSLQRPTHPARPLKSGLCCPANISGA